MQQEFLYSGTRTPRFSVRFENENMIEQFYKDNKKRLINTIAYKSKGDRVFAEDVVQEAFTKALRFYPAYDSEQGEFGPWFNTILYNTMYDMQALDKQIVTKPSEDFSVNDILTAEDFNDENTSILIQSYISRVKNNKHRKIVELFFVYGYSSREISMMMEKTSVSLVTTTVMRFKEGLKE